MRFARLLLAPAAWTCRSGAPSEAVLEARVLAHRELFGDRSFQQSSGPLREIVKAELAGSSVLALLREGGR